MLTEIRMFRCANVFARGFLIMYRAGSIQPISKIYKRFRYGQNKTIVLWYLAKEYFKYMLLILTVVSGTIIKSFNLDFWYNIHTIYLKHY